MKYTENEIDALRKAIYLDEKRKREQKFDSDFDVRHMDNVKVADLSVSQMDKLVYNAQAAALNKKLGVIKGGQNGIYELVNQLVDDNRTILERLEKIEYQMKERK
jgi:hypothetical protein